MPRHNVFTEIDSKSYAAIVKNGYLSEVLLALLVDPLEAADMADSIQRIQATRIELAFDGKIIDAPITLKDFHSLPSKDAFEKLKITLSQWVKTTDVASEALRVLSIWDRRFCVWSACAVARESLRYVPAEEQRPLRAIEAAEAWVIGRATIETVRDAYAAADDAAEDAVVDYNNAAIYAAADYAAAADAATSAAAAANAAAYVDTFDTETVAYAAANAYASWGANRYAELIRLREVVANACLTFPG
jgi:hypothetical protein